MKEKERTTMKQNENKKWYNYIEMAKFECEKVEWTSEQ